VTTKLKITDAKISASWGGFVTREEITFAPGVEASSAEVRNELKLVGDRVHNRAATVLIPMGIAVGIGIGLAFAFALGWILQ